MCFEPPKLVTQVFVSSDPSQRVGQLLDSGFSTLDIIIATSIIVTAITFVIGLVLLVICLYKRPPETGLTV